MTIRFWLRTPMPAARTIRRFRGLARRQVRCCQNRRASSEPTNATIDLTGQPAPGEPAGTLPRIDGFQGEFHITGHYSEANHLGSTRWVPDGEILDLSVTNSTNSHHPFHLHGFSFQPLSLTDGTTTITWAEPEFRDVFNVPNGATLDFRIHVEADRKLLDNITDGGSLGRWLHHCHIFHHAHGGMISELVVVADANHNQRPYVDVNGSWAYAPPGMPATRTGFLPPP